MSTAEQLDPRLLEILACPQDKAEADRLAAKAKSEGIQPTFSE